MSDKTGKQVTQVNGLHSVKHIEKWSKGMKINVG